VGAPPGAAEAADLHATPGNLATVFAGAQAGDTIQLASGDYGTFGAGIKDGWVTLTPEAGASPTMAVRFSPAAFVKLDGLTLRGVEIADARSHDLTIANSDVTGQVTLRTGELANANILLDGNRHANWDKCNNCGEGRVWLPGRTDQPSGVTIQNSQFGPGGTGDGIQNGSNGTRIINNDFLALADGMANGVHTDAIQLFGSQNTVIRGNYFHAGSGAIMAADGADHEVIDRNVFAAEDSGYPYAIMLGGDRGSSITHNTFADGPCAWEKHCGTLSISGSSGTVVRDNVLGELGLNDDSAVEHDHNLIAGGVVDRTRDLQDAPRYAGGTFPASRAGFRLTTASPGRLAASDGTDIGADVGGQTPLAPQADWSAPTGLRAGDATTLDGTAWSGPRPTPVRYGRRLRTRAPLSRSRSTGPPRRATGRSPASGASSTGTDPSSRASRAA
jgi:hypothetical protein